MQPNIPSREALRAMSGLDFLKAIKDGELPPVPIGELMKFSPVEVEHGRVVFAATPGPELFNPIGTIHGGFAATILDSCMACSVHSTLPAGTGYTSLEIKISFVKPIGLDTGEVRAEGKVLNAGRRAAFAEGTITDKSGRVLAHGTTTCLIFPL
jgi:uncharacterized protein (TIGR00369 family)